MEGQESLPVNVKSQKACFTLNAITDCSTASIGVVPLVCTILTSSLPVDVLTPAP